MKSADIRFMYSAQIFCRRDEFHEFTYYRRVECFAILVDSSNIQDLTIVADFQIKINNIIHDYLL